MFVFPSELYHHGLFPIHNRFLIAIDFLLDFRNTLLLGTSTIEAIKKKLMLLSLCEGISSHLEVNLINHCKDIEMACIGVTALLITPADLDRVICLICGVVPKIINSDGNAKDSLRITENMVYDYEDQTTPPDLETFKQMLVRECLKKSFFQNQPMKTYQMLKLPLIIAPSLIREQVNNDIKESIVNCHFTNSK